MRIASLTPAQSTDCTTGSSPVTLRWSDGSTAVVRSRATLALCIGMTRTQAITAIRSELARKATVGRPCETEADDGWGCLSAPLYRNAPPRVRQPDRVCVDGTDWPRELAKRNGTGTRWVVRVCAGEPVVLDEIHNCPGIPDTSRGA